MTIRRAGETRGIQVTVYSPAPPSAASGRWEALHLVHRDRPAEALQLEVSEVTCVHDILDGADLV
jgi:hypothetical protein